MRIIDLDKFEEIDSEISVALGNFDGLHQGHRKLIERVVDSSKKKGLSPSLLLFKEHTRSTINKKKPDMLTTNSQKIRLAKNLGIENIFLLDFTPEIMQLSEEGFVEEILIKKLKTRHVVVGFDYRFGYKARGTARVLGELLKDRDVSLDILDPIYIDGELISSSLIRDAISQGDISRANYLLGRNFALEGRVIDGKKRGAKLGYPTANLKVDSSYVMPKNGVYETVTHLFGKSYKSITSIGNNPTFENRELKIENHILNFDSTIYGEKLELELVRYLRDDIKFDSKEDLIKQIEKDIDSIS